MGYFLENRYYNLSLEIQNAVCSGSHLTAFGNLPVRIRRVLYYGLSPMEQRAWVKSVSHGLPNTVKRAIRALPTMLPSFIMSAVIYNWSTAAYYRYNRKDPKLYENDK